MTNFCATRYTLFANKFSLSDFLFYPNSKMVSVNECEQIL